MKVLLLGPNGQLGSDLTRAPGGLTLEPIGRDALNVSDVDSIGPTLDAHTFDVLVNCTSYHKTDELETNAQQAFDVNAFAVREMAAACARQGARFLHISTDYVFPGSTDRPYLETDAPGPLNTYGASKLMGESLAQAVCEDTIVFRVASLFGVAGASGKGGNFVETMIRFGREKGALRVIADQTMSPTSTADVADMIVKALDAEIPAGVYHAVNSGRASWYEFACRIIERAGVDASVDPIPHTEYPLPARRPAFSVLDNSKLTDIIGPIPDWTDALDRYLSAKGHAVATS